MPEIAPEVLLPATQAFMRMLRREHERRKPGAPNPVPLWDDMRQTDRMSFFRCVKAALEAAKIAENSEA